MSYDAVRTELARCREQTESGNEELHSLVDALEHLTEAVESDLFQIKGALSHIARLVEPDDTA